MPTHWSRKESRERLFYSTNTNVFQTLANSKLQLPTPFHVTSTADMQQPTRGQKTQTSLTCSSPTKATVS